MNLQEIIRDKQATIIDVRNVEELSEGKFPGSVNIPLHEIPHRTEEIRAMKAPLIFYCRSGNRSNIAINLLKATGLQAEMYNGGGFLDMQQYS